MSRHRVGPKVEKQVEKAGGINEKRRAQVFWGVSKVQKEEL